jgi:hypothetical protein
MTHRKDLLEKGIAVTCGPRDEEYGSPEVNMQNTANFWNAYFAARFPECDIDITPEDVAWLNNLQKVSRATSGNAGDDTYTDASVYSAIAGEVR